MYKSLTKTKVKLIFIPLVLGIFLTVSCSKENSVEPTPPTILQIIVKSAQDSSVINGANVVLYNANSGESISRTFTGTDGIAEFEDISSGNFYVRISAQGFNEVPQGSVSPIPFTALSNQTFTQTYYMVVLPGTFGKIDGKIYPNLSGFLVVATSNSSKTDNKTYSGPDGYFVLFNIPYDSYQVDAFKSAYQSSNQPQVTLSTGSPSTNVQINVNEITGSVLKGMVTFLAVENGIVDISLLDKNSLSVVNGLTTKIDTSRNYIINSIPAGKYIAWASYENDGYVMDPDWIFKNPDALNINILTDTTLKLDFSVTGAIRIISPTNPADSLIPALADSIAPTFYWDAYPQTKEYIIEVRDINGNLIWGGFTESGEIRHAQITKDLNHITFNFDGSTLSQLKSGDVYQWRIYSDDDATPGVQTLLSSSEDLMGLFITP